MLSCYKPGCKGSRGNLIVLECREHMYDKFYEGQGFKKLYDELNDESLYTLYKKN